MEACLEQSRSACRNILVSGIASLNLNISDEKVEQLLELYKAD